MSINKEPLNELQRLGLDEDPIMPWCRKVDAAYAEFVADVEAGNIPDLTIEEFMEIERQCGVKR